MCCLCGRQGQLRNKALDGHELLTQDGLEYHSDSNEGEQQPQQRQRKPSGRAAKRRRVTSQPQRGDSNSDSGSGSGSTGDESMQQHSSGDSDEE